MHPSKIAFAVALVASPLSLLTPAKDPAGHLAGSSLFGLVDARAGAPENINGRPLVDAPLSNLDPEILPAQDRSVPGFHADEAGPINGTPFSANGSGTLDQGGTAADRSPGTSDRADAVPNLGR